MYGKVMSACLHGIDGKLIEVEVDISNGLPQMNIVGLPDSAVRESMERVRSAIKNCSFQFPMERITVNLAPADLRKEGSAFDLAIAAGILLTSNQVKLEEVQKTLFIGELALDGSIRPIRGVLSMVDCAKKGGIQRIFLPQSNAQEAALIEDIEIIALENLKDLENASSKNENNLLINDINSIQHQLLISRKKDALYHDDFSDVKGQHHAKRALMIAAAGMHNILLIGPPGTGKTMLIRRLPSILQPMTEEEVLEVTKIFSVSGQMKGTRSFIQERPFRAPHHTVSAAGLIGGGTIPKPGEVSLAHRGVLFLDELPEFSRTALEVLRQPLEDKFVTIGRARAVYTFPTHFMLAASMNPCPCGYLGAETTSHACSCSAAKINQYRSRISGPLLDRIDLHVDVPRVDYTALHDQQTSLSSEEMMQQINQAVQIQHQRYKKDKVHFNGELSGRLLRKHCHLTEEGQQLLKEAFDTLGLSIRAHDRILKIARTIADLDGVKEIEVSHLAEAIQYRNLDRSI